MTKGAGSPAKSSLFFKMMQEDTTAKKPTKYISGAMYQSPPMMAPLKRAMTGSLALQGMKVVVMMVRRRSFSFSMVRLAMMPGTPQPEEIKSGMKLLPLMPN